MMRSLYSGVSGLKNHQTRMDVIGNNIANVNTNGFKSSRAVFQDIYSQMSKNASAPNGTIAGGTNPIQIGLGVSLAAIDVIHTSAATQRTDRELDFAIEGDGFFVVKMPTGQNLYTRAGNFYIDNLGNLVTSQGNFVLGIQEMTTYLIREEYVDDGGTPADTTDDTTIPAHILTDGSGGLADPSTATDSGGNNIVAADGTVAPGYRLVTGINPLLYKLKDESLTPDHELYALSNFSETLVDGTMVEANLSSLNLSGFTGIAFDDKGVISGIDANNERVTIGIIALATFTNNGGLEKKGSNLYAKSVNTGEPVYSQAQTGAAGKINPGGLEMSNVDLADQFTDMIVTQRGFQANSRIITTSDSLLEELVNLKR